MMNRSQAVFVQQFIQQPVRDKALFHSIPSRRQLNGLSCSHCVQRFTQGSITRPPDDFADLARRLYCRICI